MSNHLHAPIVGSEPNISNPAFVVVAVICPACGKTHHHGLPKAEQDIHDHRFSHCHKPSNGYFIVDDTGANCDEGRSEA